ncbi:Peroxisomal targeting signal-1 receptor family protein [Rhynchospora pubera]|uniref:Peroxisomal targeting signal-1 receptor family protein n=1 Tax=Rhynchospora pubera TaxID=906938 RepID=A0AAV8CWY2_9POAL|nr:Peroxisomal targeting signal-1 receptor family protein [Rhynchospora pubera]
MAMRDLVNSGATCAVPGSSSSNPIGALASAMFGINSKAEELNGLPSTGISVPEAAPGFRPDIPLSSIPGSEFEAQQSQLPDARSNDFLRGFHAADHGGLADAWDDVQRRPVLSPPPLPPAHFADNRAQFSEFERIYDAPPVAPTLDGPPQRVLSSVLHSFVDSGRAGMPFRPVALPMLGLSEGDKQCIRDRSCILARHIYADKSEEYISAQVNTLLQSLDIDSGRMRGPMPGQFREMEEYWNESQGALTRPPGMANHADKWASEFNQRWSNDTPDAWAQSFEQQHGANGWASEFEQEQNQMALGQLRGAAAPNMALMEQSRMLAHTLSQDTNPKFQNSKFLQFVSKMSRGELIIDDNQIKPATSDWADEYQAQHNAGPASWADQFAQEQATREDRWASEFTQEHQLEGPVDDKWVNEFSSKLNVNDWAEEFSNQAAETENWADAYDQYLGDEILASRQKSKSRGVYEFSTMNPYVGHPNPLKEGQELFRKGLLSEAVLALEAEVLKNQDNSEAWRLLGITHAENDDDQQAIAAMMRAQEADPTNLEVLLALGVSHTNELEQAEALSYLFQWLKNHPKYGTLAPPQQPDNLFYNDVAILFNEAAQLSPEDADVHIVLGVLYNLSREYDKAIAAFKTALKLKPQDYSLWNKLGATQANSIQSADAISAYQQALDLKPNYVRAWANMGISYANQGLYDESIRYYVRALTMNPKADNAWQYLKISLNCASRNDMFEACDSRNLDALQKEFPL